MALGGVPLARALVHVVATAQLKPPALVALVKALVVRAPQGDVALAQPALALTDSRCAAPKPALMSCVQNTLASVRSLALPKLARLAQLKLAQPPG